MVWIGFLGSLIGIPAMALFVLSLQFEPPNGPLTVHLFAPLGTRCATWDDIQAPKSFRHKLPLQVLPCVVADPISDLPRYIKPGEVAAALDPNLSTSGSTSEYRIAGNRYFLVRINPETFNSLTWRHEIGGHLLAGHTAAKVLLPLRFPANALLDLACVDPYLILGDYWRICMGALVMLLGAVVWFWFRSR